MLGDVLFKKKKQNRKLEEKTIYLLVVLKQMLR